MKREVENENIILNYQQLKDVSEVISCGPMEIRTILGIERQNLINGYCVYALSLACKVGNPFQVVCIRNLKGDKIFKDRTGEKVDFRVECIIPKNLEVIMDPDTWKESVIEIDGELQDISGFTRVEMTDDDFDFIIDNAIMEEASLVIDRINGLYHLHGEDDWKSIFYDAYN